MTTAETATAQCFPTFPIAPAETPLSGTHVWLTEKPHPGFAASVTAGYPWLLAGNLLNAQGKRDCLSETGTRSRSWNLYSYALNNPLKFIDPTGLCSQDANGNFTDDDNGGTFFFSGPCANGTIGDFSNSGANSVTVTANPSSVDNSWSDTSDYLDYTFLAYGFGSNLPVSAGTNPGPSIPGTRGLTSRGSRGGANACLANFYSSKLGKATAFFSPISLITDFANQWPDWTVYPGIKLAATEAARGVSNGIGGTEFLSVTGASASTTVQGAAAAGVQAAEKLLAGPGLLAIPVATALDAGARQFCASLPNATIGGAQ